MDEQDVQKQRTFSLAQTILQLFQELALGYATNLQFRCGFGKFFARFHIYIFCLLTKKC